MPLPWNRRGKLEPDMEEYRDRMAREAYALALEARDAIKRHVIAGRMGNQTSFSRGGREMVTFCSCGLAFYGASVEVSDARFDAHRFDEGTTRCG